MAVLKIDISSEDPDFIPPENQKSHYDNDVHLPLSISAPEKSILHLTGRPAYISPSLTAAT